MAVQKQQIVQTALDILDRDGLEGVTLRRLATELNIKAASIYWHIPSKEQLLDEMANAILEAHFGTFDFANDQRDWAEWLDTLAHELRAAMLARREGARVVAGAHPDIAIMLIKLWDYTIRVLRKNGYSYRDAGAIMVTLINFTFGSVIEEQASPPIAPVPERAHPRMMTVFDQYATMAEVMNAWEETDDNDARFDAGVRIIVGGVRAEMHPE
jgi:TetR/AcrR family tetracycline transcriptional repressor